MDPGEVVEAEQLIKARDQTNENQYKCRQPKLIKKHCNDSLALHPDEVAKAEKVSEFQEEMWCLSQSLDTIITTKMRLFNVDKMHASKSLKPVTCKTEVEATPAIVTATEPHPPHLLLQKLEATRVTPIYKLENQTSNAKAKYIETVEGCENVNENLFQNCLKVTNHPRTCEDGQININAKSLSKVDSNSAQTLISHYFPTKYSMVVQIGKRQSAFKKHG